MKIENLNVSKSGHAILKNLNAEFAPGKLHIIMGPNGSGKSTLSYTIARHPDCDIASGNIFYHETDLTQKDVQEVSLEGIYLAPQYPPVIEGLSHAALLKESLNIRRKHEGLEIVDDFQFLKMLREKAEQFQFDPKTYPRQSLNSGFSGGEKKRNEMLQISMLNPDFIMLDEIDSGLDIDAMQKIARFIVDFLTPEKTIVVITHYPQFAQLLKADLVHILRAGEIIKTGGTELIEQVMNRGFGEFA